MLDEDEFAGVNALYRECLRATKEFRQVHNVGLHDANLHERFKPLRLLYEELTGMKDCHQNAIVHHRLSLYGPPCITCGKPLRTPKAKLCGSCMAPRCPLGVDVH
jgi:hypothetical protein